MKTSCPVAGNDVRITAGATQPARRGDLSYRVVAPRAGVAGLALKAAPNEARERVEARVVAGQPLPDPSVSKSNVNEQLATAALSRQ